MISKLIKLVRLCPHAVFAAVVGASLLSMPASAGRIDLSGLPDGPLGTDTIVTPEGDLVTLAPSTEWFKASIAPGDFICPLVTTGCGSFMLTLALATDRLIFDVTGYDSGDKVTVEATDNAGNILKTIEHMSADPVALLGVAGLRKVTVTDMSGAPGAGFGFGNFRFGEDVQVAAPGAVSLILLGLLGLGLQRRR